MNHPLLYKSILSDVGRIRDSFKQASFPSVLDVKGKVIHSMTRWDFYKHKPMRKKKDIFKH